METGSRSVAAYSKWGGTANRYKISLQIDENSLKLIVVMAAQLCEDTKMYIFKWVNCYLT